MIVNKSKGTILAKRVSFADTWLSRFKGLMGRKKLADGEALILEPCNSIHTCFMRFSLDIIFLSSENQALHIYCSLKPWRVSKIVRGASRVIELPPGTIVKTSTQVGDNIELPLRL